MGYKPLAYVHEHSQAVGLARLLAYELAGFADNDTWECFPSLELLARRLECKKGSVSRARRTLEALGEVELLRKGGRAPATTEGPGNHRPNLYRVLGNPEQRARVRAKHRS